MDAVNGRSILIYDDRCSACTLFAMYAFKYCRGQIECMGHYSVEGQKIRKLVFEANNNETEMFWLIDGNYAYGGRSGLLPLLVLIIKGVLKCKTSLKEDYTNRHCFNSELCKNNKMKIKRLYNLLRNGKKMKVNFSK